VSRIRCAVNGEPRDRVLSGKLDLLAAAHGHGMVVILPCDRPHRRIRSRLKSRALKVLSVLSVGYTTSTAPRGDRARGIPFHTHARRACYPRHGLPSPGLFDGRATAHREGPIASTRRACSTWWKPMLLLLGSDVPGRHLGLIARRIGQLSPERTRINIGTLVFQSRELPSESGGVDWNWMAGVFSLERTGLGSRRLRSRARPQTPPPRYSHFT